MYIDCEEDTIQAVSLSESDMQPWKRNYESSFIYSAYGFQ